MTKASGVKGKSAPALARAMNAAKRQAARAQRDPREQLDLLDKRPGEARRERLRLNRALPATEPKNLAHTATEGPQRPARARTRRRAVRK